MPTPCAPKKKEKKRRLGANWMSAPPYFTNTCMPTFPGGDGTEFGRVVDGDLRMAEFGSWLQPTKADCCMQRLSVLHRRRKTAKVRGIVPRARNAMAGGPVGAAPTTPTEISIRESRSQGTPCAASLSKRLQPAALQLRSSRSTGI